MMNGTGSVRSIESNSSRSFASKCSTTCQSKRRRARDEPLELAHVGRAAQVLHEVEADAANAAVVQLLRNPRSVKRLVDVRDAAIAAAALRDRVQDHRVVDAVAARVDEHGARQAQASSAAR